jgi:cytoskeletal protein RodZ
MLSGLLKLILGFVLAIAVLVGSGVAVALYFINRTATPPPKPMYSNDNPSLTAPVANKTKAEATPSPTSEAKPETSPSPTPSASPTPSPESLPKGAYRGSVTWSQGLSLRAEPNQDAERVGGVGFNEKIIILEESQDKVWQKIRTEGSKQEGWVKVGNTQRADE